jgi:hypothetical protein
MFVCCECCVLSDRGLGDGLITRPEESHRLWCVVVCDQETSKTRRLKPATGMWKIQPRWVVTPGKQKNMVKLHGFTYKETTIFTVTAARTSNLNKSQNVKHNATFLLASVSSVIWRIYIALGAKCTDETFTILYSKLKHVYGLYQNIPVSNIKKIPSAVFEFILTYRQTGGRNILIGPQNRRT